MCLGLVRREFTVGVRFYEVGLRLLNNSFRVHRTTSIFLANPRDTLPDVVNLCGNPCPSVA